MERLSKALPRAHTLLAATLTLALASCASDPGTAVQDGAYRAGDVSPATGSQVVRRDRSRNEAIRQVDKDKIDVGRTMPEAKPGS